MQLSLPAFLAASEQADITADCTVDCKVCLSVFRFHINIQSLQIFDFISLLFPPRFDLRDDFLLLYLFSLIL